MAAYGMVVNPHQSSVGYGVLHRFPAASGDRNRAVVGVSIGNEVDREKFDVRASRRLKNCTETVPENVAADLLLLARRAQR